MANTEKVINGAENLDYQGLSRSEQSNFTLNGFDMYVKVCVVGSGYAASVDFQTDLKKVYTAKIVRIKDTQENGLVFPCTPGANGLLTIENLDEFSIDEVFAIVAVGSRT